MTSTSRPASPAGVAVALGIVYVVWGSTYLAIAIAVQTLPPLLAAGARFAGAGVLLIAFLVARDRWRAARRAAVDGSTTSWPSLAAWRTATIAGGLMLLGGNGLVMMSERFLPSGIVAIVISTVPIWLALIDSLIQRRAPTRLAIGGLAAGSVGAAILLLPTGGVDNLDPLWLLIVLTAPIWWASGTIVARDGERPSNGLLATGMQMLAGGGVMFLAGVTIGELAEADPSRFAPASLLALLYLLVVGSLVAYTAYIWLLDHAPTTTVSTYAYVNPVVAVALGTIFLSEPLTPRTLLASAIILGAVIAIVRGRRPDERAQARRVAAEIEGEAH